MYLNSNKKEGSSVHVDSEKPGRHTHLLILFIPRHMIVLLWHHVCCPCVRPSALNVYLCVLKLWTLQYISMGFIPKTHKLTDLCVEHNVQSTLVCLILDTQGYLVCNFRHTKRHWRHRSIHLSTCPSVVHPSVLIFSWKHIVKSRAH